MMRVVTAAFTNITFYYETELDIYEQHNDADKSMIIIYLKLQTETTE
ncbi:hypothetical protein LINPERPRIM_LOCUS41085 [Linum perenne]